MCNKCSLVESARSDPPSWFDSVTTNFKSQISCADDELSLHVSSELRDKICSGDIINLALLIRKDGGNPASSLVVNEKGGIDVVQRLPRQIQTI